MRAVLIVIVVVVVLVVGIGYYGGSVGLPHPLSSGSSGGSSHFGLINGTLTSYPSPEDGYSGLSASVIIANHSSQKMTNITLSLNSVDMGQCASISGDLQIAAGASGTCKIGQNVECTIFPTPPYVIAVTAKYADGSTASNSLTINSGLTTTC
jgi:hypothetical protein